MRRRSFIGTLAAVSVGTTGVSTLSGEGRAANAGGTISAIAFDSTSSLLNANEKPLTDDSTVAVWAEDAAQNKDTDGNGDAVDYGDQRIPLVAVDGNVVGVGCPLVNEGADFSVGTEEFLLNVWDEEIGGGTVLWDEGHGQFYTLDKFAQFEQYAEGQGYDVQATTALTDDLDGADAVVITSANEFSQSELSALGSFVDDGGVVFLHDQSDYNDYDTTTAMNGIASALDVGFRFNDDQVVDAENNAGVEFVPKTSQFNDSFPYFADRLGIGDGPDLDPAKTYDVEVTNVTDGDTFDVAFPSGATETVRVLGVDTPEKPAAAKFETPMEWEGLADDSLPTPFTELAFDSTSSLLDADEQPLTDDSTVAVWAEDTASNADQDGAGDAVDYGDQRIPLVAVDDNVIGVGCPFVNDDADFAKGNEEFLLNVLDYHVGGGTVLWDESHDQFYTLDKFSRFEEYAAKQGYDLNASDDLAADLADASAVVITSPGTAFSEAELDKLATFRRYGGTVLLLDQSDFRNFDNTDNLNAIADSLSLSFRFNDDQVTDDDNNAGRFFVPLTGQFNHHFPYFGARDGLAEQDGSPYLEAWSQAATDFGAETLEGKTVTLGFDETEGLRGSNGRLLAYTWYDDNGNGKNDDLYNARLIEDGYARVYDSSFDRHDDFLDSEQFAQFWNHGLWRRSDPYASPQIRNRPVDDLFVPKAESVRTESGAVSDGRVPVYAGEAATQSGGEVSYADDVPLAALDEHSRVGVVGGAIIDEDYDETDFEFDADTAQFENFTFLTNLIDHLSARDGDVLIDGGHGQPGADYALGGEDTYVYMRYLEGVDLGYDQINDITWDNLNRARALIVTAPQEAYSKRERRVLRSFANAGGAVILLGNTTAPEAARSNLNELADALGTDLRLNGDAVTDAQNNVRDETFPVTGNFDESFPLFDAFSRYDERVTDSVTDRLSGTDDSQAYYFTPDTYDPVTVRISLSSPSDADFDLYVTYDGRTPAPSDYDEAALGSEGQDSVVVDGLGPYTELGILVHAHDGSGEFTLDTVERGN